MVRKVSKYTSCTFNSRIWTYQRFDFLIGGDRFEEWSQFRDREGNCRWPNRKSNSKVMESAPLSSALRLIWRLQCIAPVAAANDSGTLLFSRNRQSLKEEMWKPWQPHDTFESSVYLFRSRLHSNNAKMSSDESDVSIALRALPGLDGSGVRHGLFVVYEPPHGGRIELE